LALDCFASRAMTGLPFLAARTDAHDMALEVVQTAKAALERHSALQEVETEFRPISSVSSEHIADRATLLARQTASGASLWVRRRAIGRQFFFQLVARPSSYPVLVLFGGQGRRQHRADVSIGKAGALERHPRCRTPILLMAGQPDRSA